MNFQKITHSRLKNQQITGTDLKTPQEIVAYMGAMQAQDYAMAKWGIGVRLPNTTDEMIEKAIDNAEIIRTHILRPTWHFVAAENIHWLLDLTAPHVMRIMNSSNKQMELTEEVLSKTNKIIEKSLEGGKHKTREELMEILGKAKIPTNEFRSAHIMMNAELQGIVANGSRRAKQFTYALLEERVPKTQKLTKEEALAKLTQLYFSSHAPATIQDFCWWSGLKVSDAKLGLELTKNDLNLVNIENQIFYFSDDFKPKMQESIQFLPAFDEFIVSYKDRTASLDAEIEKLSIIGYGIFKPIIVINGKVEGIWKRTIKKNETIIETTFSDSKIEINKELFEKAMKSFRDFVGGNKL